MSPVVRLVDGPHAGADLEVTGPRRGEILTLDDGSFYDIYQREDGSWVGLVRRPEPGPAALPLPERFALDENPERATAAELFLGTVALGAFGVGVALALPLAAAVGWALEAALSWAAGRFGGWTNLVLSIGAVFAVYGFVSVWRRPELIRDR